jgi:hypothetical protein
MLFLATNSPQGIVYVIYFSRLSGPLTVPSKCRIGKKLYGRDSVAQPGYYDVISLKGLRKITKVQVRTGGVPGRNLIQSRHYSSLLNHDAQRGLRLFRWSASALSQCGTQDHSETGYHTPTQLSEKILRTIHVSNKNLKASHVSLVCLYVLRTLHSAVLILG